VIQRTPEGNQLLYKLIPVEVTLQIIALGVFMYHFQDRLTHLQVLYSVGLIGAANALRLLLTFVVRTFVAPKAEGHGTVVSTLIIFSNLLTGLGWGAGLVYLDWQSAAFSFNDPIVTTLLTGLILASLVGSALWSWLFLAFAIPAIGSPLAWFVFNNMKEQLIIWGFYALAVSVVFWVITRCETTFVRYRQTGKQNSSLLKELAAAKEDAVRTQKEIERAHSSLQAEMQERKKVEEQIRASERETTRILQDMQDTYFRVDAKGKILRISPSIRYLLGYADDALIGSRFADLFSSATDYRKLTQTLQKQCGVLENYEVRLRHTMGEEVWVSINAHNSGTLADDGQGFEGTARDVTDTRKSAEALFLEKERLHVTLESIGDGVITTDTRGTVVYMNPIAEMMTGWDEKQAKGKPLQEVLRLLDEVNAKPLTLPLRQWLKEGRRCQLSNPAVLQHKLKERDFTIELSGSPIRNAKGNVIGAVLAFHNVTKLRTLTKQLSYQASHDALTGLINRSEFENRVEHSIRSAHNDNKQHALCYVDLDQFKVVNDTCGHHAGDDLLKQVTALMQDKLRASDTLARLGGDEFGILLMGCDIRHAQKVAENIRAAVEAFRFVWEDHIFRIGTSIGLVSISRETQSLNELLSAADSACYVAKEGGRNLVHTYSQDDDAIARQHGQMQWKERIQKALDEDRFELHFQTIAPVKANQKSGQRGEILLRMVDDNKNNKNSLIMPGAFIPAAERYQLMPHIDRWVISHALAALKGKLRTEKWECCFINLSGQALSDPKLLDYVLAEIKRHKVPPRILCFEITESAMIANFDNANRLITTLRELGCQFALDDFGSGMSSFAYLKNLNVDYLKLDGEIVKDVAKDRASYAMIHAINQVAHVMEMKTVAEHVETQDIFEALRKLGIDYVQGYGIAYPEIFNWSAQKHTRAS